MIDLGGQLVVHHEGEDERAFELALAHPRERSRIVARLTVVSGSVATSGNSERGLVIDGERHGHILDPRSGRPARDFGSLTVWASDAFTADCLATGLYVLGPDEARGYPAGENIPKCPECGGRLGACVCP